MVNHGFGLDDSLTHDFEESRISCRHIAEWTTLIFRLGDFPRKDDLIKMFIDQHDLFTFPDY